MRMTDVRGDALWRVECGRGRGECACRMRPVSSAVVRRAAASRPGKALGARVGCVLCGGCVWHMRAMRTDGGGSCAGSSVKRPIILGYGCAVVR